MRQHNRSIFVFASTLIINLAFAASWVSAQDSSAPKSQAQASSLNEKLIAEDPGKLSKEARERGDIVRGAILFHQGNINCAKCHRPAANQDRIGPDLSLLDAETTDEMIIESILQPSLKIAEEYKPVVILTVDGRTISGTKVSEDDTKVVIRDLSNVDNLITILRDDLDQIRPGKQSSMPAELANQLKNRQQFLDLLRYVFDTQERGPDANTKIAQASDQRRSLEPELEGLMLIQKRNCFACHATNSIYSPVASKKAPRLSWSAANLNPNYLQSFIADPHALKPGSTMPQLFNHLDDADRKSTATAITHFLISKTKNDFKNQPIDGEAMHRGYSLFHSVGCTACHSPRDESSTEQPLDDSIPMADLTKKYNISALTQLLEDPLAVRPSGHMPNMQLTHREAVDIANYLLQSSEKKTQSWTVDPDLAKKGEAMFTQHNCSSCHTELVQQENGKPEARLAKRTSLDKMDPEQGCLSEKTGNWPNFQLSSKDRELIQAALKSPPTYMTNKQKTEFTLSTFNCVACHSRNDLGGIKPDRNPHFQTTNLNVGDQGRIPPTLTGVGAKLKPKWMRDVMVNGRSIRPYMKTRMPQYGEDNVGHLIELFQKNDRVDEITHATFTDQKETRLKGLSMAGNKGLNCVACHTYQYKISDTMPAVDLTEMTERLKKDWFYQYMLAPQKFSPNTVMPSFWPDGKAIRADLEGTPEDQIEALWQYLIDGRQARAPSGVVREPLEIIVTDEAQMLRRSYPGIGKRGIGVGYPGGINIAYDAEQMRLGNIWSGKFAEASGVWRGQGNGNVRPMSRPVELAKGPELDDAENPWVVDNGRPPKHQFKGYDLDKKRQPTFRYEFDTIRVMDFFSPSTVEASSRRDSKGNDPKTKLVRTITLSSGQARDGLNFRIASANEITGSEGVFLIDKKLKARVLSEHTARIETADNGAKQLIVSLKLTADSKLTLKLEYELE